MSLSRFLTVFSRIDIYILIVLFIVIRINSLSERRLKG